MQKPCGTGAGNAPNSASTGSSRWSSKPGGRAHPQRPAWTRALQLLRLLFFAGIAQSHGMVHGQQAFVDRLVGDVGAGLYRVQDVSVKRRTTNLVLPYLYADYGRYYVRSDTFGVKTVPFGYGYLELAGRISFDGVTLPASTGALYRKHRSSLPLGVGTFQETPLGAVFVYAFHDLRSGGDLAEATYTAPLPIGRATLYPEIGGEFRSARSARHLFGVSAQEAGALGNQSYASGRSRTPFLGLAVQLPIHGPWSVNGQWRREWLDAPIRHSPLVSAARQDTALLALTYTFK